MARTHGWVLPGKVEQRFAVCWNGLVYPAISVGEPADLRADVRAAVQKTGRRWQNALPEGFTMAHETCLPINGCLLFRLGDRKGTGQTALLCGRYADNAGIMSDQKAGRVDSSVRESGVSHSK